MNRSHYARGFSPLVVIIIIVALAAGGILVYQTVDITPITPALESQSDATSTTEGQVLQNENPVSDAGLTVFISYAYGLEFRLPASYTAVSNQYGVTDATQAEDFFFRQESDDYNNIPVLDVSTKPLPSGQTLRQFTQSIYSLNKDKNYVTTELKSGNYDGIAAYEFNIQTGYVVSGGSRLLDSSGGKVVLLYQNGKVFQFLQTGADTGLISILNSVKFNRAKFTGSQKTTSTYQNTEVGIRFEHPKTWVLKTNTQTGSRPQDGISGKYAEICDTQNGFCFVRFFSADYELHGMDNSGLTIFRGVTNRDQETLNRCPVLAVSCVKKKIAGKQAIDIVAAYKDEAAVWHTRRTVFVANPGAGYTGIALVVPLSSLNQSTQTSLPGSIEEKELYVQEASRRISAGTLSAEDKDFLAGLDTILSTFSFTQ